MMNSVCGDELLTVFEKLDVSIGSLKREVIFGWFDTDSLEIINFLTWICTELNDDNYMSPQQYTHKVQQCLSSEYHKVSSDHIRQTLSVNSEHEKCHQLAIDLDEDHIKLYKNILMYNQSFYDYEFVNVFDVFHTAFDDIEENLLTLKNCWKADTVCNTTTNTVYLNDENVNNTVLSTITDKFSEGKLELELLKVEIEALTATMEFINTADFNVYTVDDADLICNIQQKQQDREVLVQQFIKCVIKAGDECIENVKMHQIQSELNNLNNLMVYTTDVSNQFRMLLAQVELMRYLCSAESVQVSTMYKFFSDVMGYIEADLNDCANRNEATSKTLEAQKQYYIKMREYKLPLIEYLKEILSISEDASPNSVLHYLINLKNDVKYLEKALYSERLNFNLIKSILMENRRLEQFLRNGPTHGVVVIPAECQSILKTVNSAFEQQKQSIKSTTDMYRIALQKLQHEKWRRIFRLLWMYFIDDPRKMLSLISELKQKNERNAAV